MLELNDCLYVPAISRNIISVSCLDKSGFIISIKDKSLSVYRKNVSYANANMTNELYVLDLDMPVYNIPAKRNKPNGLNQTYLWLCSCEAYVKRLMTNGKLDAKSDKCFFVGYPKKTRGYSFYHPIDKKVFVACNGVFLEKEFLSNATSGRKIELEEIRDDEETSAPVQEHELEEQTVVPQNAQDTQEPCRSNRLRTQPKGNDIPTLTTVKTWLSKSFSMKDLGDACYALGIRIYRDRSRKLLGLSQSTYIDKVLARLSMSESKRRSLPMVQGTSLSKTQGASTPEEVERMGNVPYASAIGSIMYAMGGKEELSIVGYTDASFQTDKDDFKSQAGKIPKSIIKSLHTRMSNFLWGKVDGRNKYHWATWEKLCFPKEEGGLGLTDLTTIQEAYGLKMWWTYTQNDSLWAKFMRARYPRGLDTAPKIIDSIYWKRLYKANDIAQSLFHIDDFGRLWWNNNDAGFSMKKAKNSLREKNPIHPFTKSCWTPKQTPKHSLFLWKLSFGYLPLPQSLTRMGFHSPSQ
ncbi:unnamed protein product [Cuscuta campestris]|uniref:Retroviral polymerase SH3-like domain-containing protein n=1 Tax=Cuscuta campestris TaxID=132261 RepID=A0A484KIW1_9ASTE|nr:unnamed protein product [Cuscuta campestris]